MIKNLLKGINSEGENALDLLQSKIGDRPNIAWYPSSNLDFRDLIEVNRTGIEPDLFFHTDYDADWVKLECGIVYDDRRTKVRIDKITEVKFRNKVNYTVNSEFVDFPEKAFATPKVFLLDVHVEGGFTPIYKPVLFFFMENINFLDEVLLKNKMNLSHFIKVSEGCAWGGNKKSISLAYAFLANLNVKHILVDDHADIDINLIKKVSQKHNLQPLKYCLKNASQRRNISSWSGRSVKVLDVIPNSSELLTDEHFNLALTKITSL